MNTTIQVQANGGPYPVIIGSGLRHQIGTWLAAHGFSERALFIVTDNHVANLGYLDDVKAALTSAGLAFAAAVVPAGDASKSLTETEKLYRQMLTAGIRRSDVVVALGGGAVGDLAGFAAATYLRGIAFIQMPTTLLAHDSSVGGKVGVNLDAGKNLVGAFHQPKAVIYDTDCLATLPEREWQNGMAEVVKHGLIGNEALFYQLADNPVPSFPGPERASAMIAEAVRVKVAIVEQDEHESELRMVLNVGHTIGHAIERLSNYALGHGEAIAIGLVVEANIARRMGILSDRDETAIATALAKQGLPTTASGYQTDEMFRVLSVDKKHTGKTWTFALPTAIGEVRIVRDVPRDVVAAALDTCG